MMKIDCILLLSGVSKRFKDYQNDINKVYYKLNNKELFTYALDTFLLHPSINKIILVYNNSDIDLLNKALVNYDQDRLIKTLGDKERYLSVYNGLKHVKTSHVLVSDGARCNIDYQDLDNIINCSSDCCSLGYPIFDALKRVENDSVTDVVRSYLYCVQTPQKTKTQLLLDCIKKVKEDEVVVDDLYLVEKYSNAKIKIIEGSRFNIKVTTKNDLEMIKKILCIE